MSEHSKNIDPTAPRWIVFETSGAGAFVGNGDARVVAVFDIDREIEANMMARKLATEDTGVIFPRTFIVVRGYTRTEAKR